MKRRKKSRLATISNAFKKIIFNYADEYGRRNLPWRKTKNPYRILVSEVMLQQTQVDRVVPYYRAFLKRFPTVVALAEASLSDVLRAWQGLGYNRRAKMLHEAANYIMINHGGRLPRAYRDLIALPGVGDYTAKAVRVFAYNEPEIMIETNIRTVFLHHFFKDKQNVSDKEVFWYVEASLDKKKPRAWYAALMDYGTHLKKTTPNPSRKSKHHVRQKKFKGSDREVRGAVLACIVSRPQTRRTINTLPFERVRTARALTALIHEGLVVRRGRLFTLPG